MTLCLLVAGGLVTSYEAGLSVPDWPLSYGQLMPPMIGGVFYEHGHRMIASFVGLLTIVLAVWLWRREPRAWVRRLGAAALSAVVLQGLLGGVTVLFLLPVAVSVGHACLAQLFFCMVVALAWVTSPGWRRRRAEYERAAETEDERPSLRRLALAANAAIFVQLALGAALRHKALGVAPHLVGAGVVAVLAVWIVARVVRKRPAEPPLAVGALALNLLVMLQLVLGSASYWIRVVTADAPQPLPVMAVLTVSHLALGALILASSVIFTLEVHARFAPRSIPLRQQEHEAAAAT